MSLQNPGAFRLRWTDALLDNLDQGDARGARLLDRLAHPDRQRAIERRIITAGSDLAILLAASLAERGMTPSSRVVEHVLADTRWCHEPALFSCRAYGPDVQDYILRLAPRDVRRLLLQDAMNRRPLEDEHREWLYERALSQGFQHNRHRDSELLCCTLDFEASQDAFDEVLDGSCLRSMPDLPEARVWLKSQPGLFQRAFQRLEAPHFLMDEQPASELARFVAAGLCSSDDPTWHWATLMLRRLPNLAAELCDQALAIETIRHRRLTLSGMRISCDPPCDFAALENDGVYSAFASSFGRRGLPSGSEAFTRWALDHDVYFRDAFISRAERGHSLRAKDLAKAAAGDALLQTVRLGLQAKDNVNAIAELEARARGAEHVVLRAEALRALRHAGSERAAIVALDRILIDDATADYHSPSKTKSPPVQRRKDDMAIGYYAPFMTEAAVCLTPSHAEGVDDEACLEALIRAYSLAPGNDAMAIIDFSIGAWFSEGPIECGRPWSRTWQP